MPMAKIDYAFAAAAVCQPGKKKTDYWDTEIKGLILEVRCTGKKTYHFRYLDQSNRQRCKKVGGFDDITNATARKEAQRLRSEVVLGGDPAAKKAHAKAVPLYRELAEAHIAHSKLHHRSAKTMEMYLRRHLMEKWGKYRLTEIDPRAVSQWLAEKRAEGLAPASVEKLRVIMSRSFVLASQWGMAGAENNPIRRVPKVRFNNARERYLSAEEAARLRAAVAQSQNKQLAAIVGLLLLTGARVRELLDAKWENVHVERRSWYIPDTKTGRPRHVPLSTPALEIIQGLTRFERCPWLVPNPETLKPFVSIQHSWERATRVAGLKGLRIHDLRHSAASFLVAAGVDLYAVGKVLGHASVASSARYSHLAAGQLLAAVEAGAAKQIG